MTVPSQQIFARGHQLGPYQIRRLIGQGGMGQVYRAWDTNLRRDVAIKVLGIADPSMLRRFAREANAIAPLHHPNIVQLHDSALDQVPPYIVMELLRGTPLITALKNGPIPLAEAISIALAVCNALRACHRLGVIHRDIKPGNVFLAEDPDFGRVAKVLDFGIAKPAKDADDLTAPGFFSGTVRYAAPEQFSGFPADELTDQYSLGLMLYSTLSAHVPFSSYDGNKPLVDAIRRGALTPLPTLLQTIPPELNLIILSATNTDRSCRYQSIDDFARALLPWAPPHIRSTWEPAPSAIPELPTQPERPPKHAVASLEEQAADEDTVDEVNATTAKGLVVPSQDGPTIDQLNAPTVLSLAFPPKQDPHVTDGHAVAVILAPMDETPEKPLATVARLQHSPTVSSGMTRVEANISDSRDKVSTQRARLKQPSNHKPLAAVVAILLLALLAFWILHAMWRQPRIGRLDGGLQRAHFQSEQPDGDTQRTDSGVLRHRRPRGERQLAGAAGLLSTLSYGYDL